MWIPLFDAVWRFDIVDYDIKVGDDDPVLCRATTERVGSFSYRITMTAGARYHESIIAHEATHMALMVLEDAGVVESGNHECLAYLVEYLVKTMVSIWKRQTD